MSSYGISMEINPDVAGFLEQTMSNDVPPRVILGGPRNPSWPAAPDARVVLPADCMCTPEHQAVAHDDAGLSRRPV